MKAAPYLILTCLLFIITADLFAQPQDDQLIFQERTRRFVTFLPQDFAPENNHPLVINMHPFLTNGQFQMLHSRFNRLADTAGVVVVYPFGIQGRWNSGSFFGIEGPVDDVGFLDVLIDYMAVLYGIDTRRVYATGYSAGGFMSHRLACELTNRIAAIAPVSASMNSDLVTTCNPPRPVPVMAFNGTADLIVPFNGFPTVASVAEVFALWSTINGCDDVPVETELPDISQTDNTTTTRISYTGCDNASELILDRINNGSHTWPGREFPLLGNSSMDEDANVEMWEFFKRHKIPGDIACDRPAGLSSEYADGTVELQWDAVDGIESYEVVYILPGGQLMKSGPLTEEFLSLNGMEGDLIWTVSSTCTSGHRSWAPVQVDALGGRFEAGRIAVSAYPNPAVEFLHIAFEGDRVPESVSIIHPMGEVITTIPIHTRKTEIDISGLPAGLYYVVSNDGRSASASFRKY